MGTTFSYVRYGVKDYRQVEVTFDLRANYSGAPRWVMYGDVPPQDKGGANQWCNNSSPEAVTPDSEKRWSPTQPFDAWFTIYFEHQNSGSHVMRISVTDRTNKSCGGYCVAVRGLQSTDGHKEFVYSQLTVKEGVNIDIRSKSDHVAIKVWKDHLVEPDWQVGWVDIPLWKSATVETFDTWFNSHRVPGLLVPLPYVKCSLSTLSQQERQNAWDIFEKASKTCSVSCATPHFPVVYHYVVPTDVICDDRSFVEERPDI